MRLTFIIKFFNSVITTLFRLAPTILVVPSVPMQLSQCFFYICMILIDNFQNSWYMFLKMAQSCCTCLSLLFNLKTTFFHNILPILESRMMQNGCLILCLKIADNRTLLWYNIYRDFLTLQASVCLQYPSFSRIPLM